MGRSSNRELWAGVAIPSSPARDGLVGENGHTVSHAGPDVANR